MKKRIPIPLGEGKEIWVELEESVDPNSVASNRPEYYSRSQQLGEAVEVIRPLVEKITSPLLGLSQKPTQIELEFAFRFGSEAEVILTPSPSEALVKVKLSFSPQ